MVLNYYAPFGAMDPYICMVLCILFFMVYGALSKTLEG